LDAVREAITRHLADLQAAYDLSTPEGSRALLEARREKFRVMGRFVTSPE
jgi:hypothetical protein